MAMHVHSLIDQSSEGSIIYYSQIYLLESPDLWCFQRKLRKWDEYFPLKC